MTAPTLTSEQRPHHYMNADGFCHAGGDATQEHVAVMVADAAHEAEAKADELAAELSNVQADYDRRGARLWRLAGLAGHVPSDSDNDSTAELAVTQRLDELADLRGAVEALAGEWQGATCQTDGAPCSWHRVAAECADDLRALLNASSNP